MRFSHKIAKLADPRTLRSAKQHVGRVLFPRGPARGNSARRIIASIDQAQFQQIYQRYIRTAPPTGWGKFLDLEQWIERNLERARVLELDFGRPRSVLDLGCGAGYFLYICQWFGHQAVGLDIEGVPLYPEMERLLGLRRVIWRIEPFTPLPDLGAFDLITAFMVCFNQNADDELWGVEEWDFFLDDLRRHLKPGGRVWLELNPHYNGAFLTDELHRFFRDRGVHVERHKVSFGAPALAAK